MEVLMLNFYKIQIMYMIYPFQKHVFLSIKQIIVFNNKNNKLMCTYLSYSYINTPYKYLLLGNSKRLIISHREQFYS